MLQSFYTAKEVAAMCRVTIGTVDRWVKQGRLVPVPGFSSGRGITRLFGEDAVRGLLSSSEGKGGEPCES